MTAENILEQTFNLHKYRMAGGVYHQTEEAVLEAMQEYARMKCKELLQIVAEKARTKNTSEEIRLYGDFTGYYVKTVDKESILNAVDLDSFCS